LLHGPVIHHGSRPALRLTGCCAFCTGFTGRSIYRAFVSETTGISVLVVDDHPTNLRLLGGMLHSRGYRVLEATDGSRALEILTHERPTLVMLDIQMPGLSGKDVARRLRADPHRQDLILIAVTALAMPGDRENILAAGFDDYLAKPFKVTDVLAKVDEWLERAHRQHVEH
jgi:CheY-like chemotaxis protein